MDWPLAYLQIIAGEWSRADKRRTRTWRTTLADRKTAKPITTYLL